MVKEVTSAQANKILKKLYEDRNSLLENEKKSSVFNAASCEDEDKLRPKYDFGYTTGAIRKTEQEIRNLKHRINVFNVNTVIPEFEITIDEALVLIPQLSDMKKKLDTMRNRLARERVSGRYYNSSGNYIDYTVTNYSIQEADKEYRKVSEMLSSLQTALDTVNNTETFEIDI